MKEMNSAPGGLKSFQEARVTKLNGTLKTVWMADFKKAGERVECLWSKTHDLRQNRKVEKS